MYGQLGIGVDPASAAFQPIAYSPVPVLDSSGSGTLSGIVALASGWYHSCALTSVGTVYCWGANPYGQLGQNTSTFYELVPVQVTGVGGVNFLTGVTAITAGGQHTCALLSSGDMVCWGDNFMGSLGNNNPFGSENAPVNVLDTSGTGNLNLGH